MPTMGVPDSVTNSNPFNGIQMGKNLDLPTDKLDANLLEKINGKNPNKRVYGDPKKGTLGRDEFMKLFMNQIQHQDPMKPMEQDKFIGELAQFSQLEQLSNINRTMTEQDSNKLAEMKFYAASFLGKKILSVGNSFQFLGEGTKARLGFNLKGDAEESILRIYDKKGAMIAEKQLGPLKQGLQNENWGGETLDGQIAAKGDFTFEVLAWDKSYQKVGAETKVSGIVTGVGFENNQTVLNVGGRKLTLKEVDSIETDEGKRLDTKIDTTQNL